MAVSENTGGTQTADAKAIVSSTNATPIVVTITAHGWSNGDHVSIIGHLVNTAANGHWAIANVAANTFELVGSVGNGVGGATGSAGKELTLATITAAGTYQLVVDLGNLAAGDDVELRIRVKVRSGNTLKSVFTVSYADLQGEDAIALSPPVPAPFEFVATLTQPRGTTGRAFIWSIYEY